MKYPEHEKLAEVKDRSQAVGEFVDWLAQTKKIHLAVWMNETEMTYAREPITDLLAEFFEIDQKKLEDEKRAMLDEMRAAYQ